MNIDHLESRLSLGFPVNAEILRKSTEGLRRRFRTAESFQEFSDAYSVMPDVSVSASPPEMITCYNERVEIFPCTAIVYYNTKPKLSYDFMENAADILRDEMLLPFDRGRIEVFPADLRELTNGWHYNSVTLARLDHEQSREVGHYTSPGYNVELDFPHPLPESQVKRLFDMLGINTNPQLAKMFTLGFAGDIADNEQRIVDLYNAIRQFSLDLLPKEAAAEIRSSIERSTLSYQSPFAPLFSIQQIFPVPDTRLAVSGSYENPDVLQEVVGASLTYQSRLMGQP